MSDEMIEIEYNRARRLIESDKLETYIEAKKILLELKDYKDSKKYLEEANSRINILESEKESKKEEDYNRAVELISGKKTSQKLDQAIKIFKELDDYKDSKELLEVTLANRKKIMTKDKKNLDRFKLLGYILAGLGVVFIALIICAVIWSIVSNGGAE